ncbi:MAG: glycosyltransferase family 2 protein [Blastocatellia bacterium]|nr:glycosyltransferase family 2 protein [Blastocatellia bacterium]
MKENREAAPFVSVLLPIRNEARHIESALGAVLAQDYPADRMEVIVIDGLSDDGTRERVEAAAARDARVRLLDNPRRIVPTGMNLATARARGDVLIRVDGHCEIARDYVRRCVAHLRDDGVDGVGGPVTTIGETPLSEVIALAMSSRFGVGDSSFRTVTDRTMLADTVPFPAYTRAIIDRVGPYDEELVRNQDDDYNYRLRKLGAKVLLAADIRSRYYSRGTIRRLWRQYFQYGFWKVRVMQKHPRQMRPRQFAPPTFVFALLAAALLAIFSVAGAWPLGLVAGAYALANLAASAQAARGKGARTLLILPVVFATLHVAYGLGFLAGLLRFWNRWGDHESRFA